MPEAAPLSRSTRPRLLLAGASALVWIPHVVDLVRVGEGVHLLWICNLAGGVLTVGCALGQPALISVATLWLSFGTPLFLISALGGGDHQLSSWVSHFGGLAVGALAIGRFSWSRSAWWLATLGQLALLGFTRLATDPRENINVAHSVWEGWEDVFPSYPVYFVCLLGLSVVIYLVLSLAIGRAFGRLAPGAEAREGAR